MRAISWFSVGVCWVLALPAGAEVVVLKDGSRFETRGAFTVKGRQVVFTDAQGKLMALPLAEVDLEASQAPPSPPAAVEAPAAKVERKVVMTLTDKDVAHRDPESLGSTGGGQKSVEMYSTTWCPACKKARSFFAENGIEFSDYDIELDEAARRRRNAKHSSCGVPVIEIDGDIFCGFSSRELKNALGIGKKKPDASKSAATATAADADEGR